MDFSQTKFSWQRPLTSYTKVQHLLGMLYRNRESFIDKAKVGAKDYLDIGCGPNRHAEFINLDYGWQPGIDICWDVTRGIPPPDAAVKGIFSEHCFEHLPFESIEFVLGECRRVLKPGGRIRIVMPDGELYLTRYSRIIGGETCLMLPFAENHSVGGIYSPILTINRIFRHHGHLFIYDFGLLQQLLATNGFVDIGREEFGSGRDPRLLIDSEAREVESLYVEASRPA